ncbi:bifunctional 3-(3-hydroxy-phenyl)propionate/3-hydroxycinnamic acid hydroxylase [Sphingomonas sp.]|uniref:bifunctional 3-(3-hydroxy-phenyl)propionate/3-hydroxycinnamic acid hydroxylase MhpA n=1 Tax=Sphingomonas sp. TaxID=28214 RepID=UPI0025D3424D|nr:bifunctional 3-(3-hydroxy-phenyl)propionate/3-hydroxycinnamic acid hydroxylase [Sphingomonas sp.]
MSDAVYDVIQIGYGPVSEALALMLGRQGRSVAVCERWTERYPLPRAVCVDHELYRVLAANGMGDILPSVTHAGPLYQWFNADWKELLVIDWQKTSISGGPEVNFVHQPTLEKALDLMVQTQSSVAFHMGWEAISIEQDAELAHVVLRHADTGVEKRLSARYVVGCDGANSIVREAIGSTRENRGFEADWLVIDVLLKDGVTIEKLGIPDAGQYCNPARPTTIVPAGVRDGKKFRRWEFMRLPGETVEELERVDRVWELLSAWAGPDDVELVRHKVYNFRSLIADRWRDRRLLIAGDAAHVMPPFMGQGMCSGLRDAWNLSWKLALILDGKADDRLLDTYQTERLPHVSQITDMAIFLGQMICIPDPAAAAERDLAFLGGAAPPLPPFPQLVGGLLHHAADDQLQSGAGLLSPHGMIEQYGHGIRLDDLVHGGSGFVVITRGFDGKAALDPSSRDALATLGVHYIDLSTNGSADAVRDIDGRIDAFLDERGWSAMIVRPDFYVYGGADDRSNFAALARTLIADLTVAGVHVTKTQSDQNPKEHV